MQKKEKKLDESYCSLPSSFDEKRKTLFPFSSFSSSTQWERRGAFSLADEFEVIFCALAAFSRRSNALSISLPLNSLHATGSLCRRYDFESLCLKHESLGRPLCYFFVRLTRRRGRGLFRPAVARGENAWE